MKFWIDKGGFIYLFQILKAAGAIHDYKDVSLAIKHGQVSVNEETCFKQKQVLKVGDNVHYKKLHIRILERDELGRTDEEIMRLKKPEGNVKHGYLKEWDHKPIQKNTDIIQEMEETSRKLHENLLKSNLTLAIAESCTGGMVQSLITSHAGSSAYFLGGIVSYSDLIKQKILKVDKQILEKYGAVSPETCREMALNIAKLFASDFAASITGIAGPTGGTKEKPVGTVHIAVIRNERLIDRSFLFRGTRDMIRKKSTLELLKMILANI